jgi:putative transposase
LVGFGFKGESVISCSSLQPKIMRAEYKPLTDSQWQFTGNFLNVKRKRKHDLREVFDAIRWVTKTGVQWRELKETQFPKWQIVYYYHRVWRKNGVFFSILRAVVKSERERQNRESEASVGAIDSQSVKKGMFVSEDTGIDGNKKINGRKRHIIVDSLGLPLLISVTAANVYDGNEGKNLLPELHKVSSRMQLIRADDTYKGSFVEDAEAFKWVVEFGQKPESSQGFVPQKGRWQVERSFSWLNPFRRLSKDYEKTIESSAAFISMAFIDLILARMT